VPGRRTLIVPRVGRTVTLLPYTGGGTWAPVAAAGAGGAAAGGGDAGAGGASGAVTTNARLATGAFAPAARTRNV
jgi:hypothetical protein